MPIVTRLRVTLVCHSLVKFICHPFSNGFVGLLGVRHTEQFDMYDFRRLFHKFSSVWTVILFDHVITAFIFTCFFFVLFIIICPGQFVPNLRDKRLKEYRIGLPAVGRLSSREGGGGGGVHNKCLYGEARPRSPTPYPFIHHFSRKRYHFRIPSIDKWCPFHIPCLEIWTPLNYCKCTVFWIAINYKNRTFSRNVSTSPFGPFYRTNERFPYLFYILQLVKSLPFHIPEAWKRYPFRAEPPRIGDHREYPPGLSSLFHLSPSNVCTQA